VAILIQFHQFFHVRRFQNDFQRFEIRPNVRRFCAFWQNADALVQGPSQKQLRNRTFVLRSQFFYVRLREQTLLVRCGAQRAVSLKMDPCAFAIIDEIVSWQMRMKFTLIQRRQMTRIRIHFVQMIYHVIRNANRAKFFFFFKFFQFQKNFGDEFRRF